MNNEKKKGTTLLKRIENNIKNHILVYLLVSFILGSVIGPIIVQNYIWSKEPKIIIFAKKEIIPIDKLGVYNIDSFFSIHNPKDEPLIVNSRYVKIPTKIFFGEPYEPSKPMVRPVEPGDEISKPFMIEVKPKDTETIKVSFSINVSKEGLYPVSYCIMSLGKEICSEETYTQIEVKFEDDEE